MSSSTPLTQEQIDQLRRLGITVPDSQPVSTPASSTPDPVIPNPEPVEGPPVEIPFNPPSPPVPSLPTPEPDITPEPEPETPAKLPPSSPPTSEPIVNPEPVEGPETISDIPQNNTNNIKDTQILSLTSGQILNQTISGNQQNRLLKGFKSPLIPLFSISGLTLISFGGILLLKTHQKSVLPPTATASVDNSESAPQPTQVPKSIQHYLLTSQQFFTQAIDAQTANPATLPQLLNQSILAATSAITEFPDDYRGYQQRAVIYQSLISSQPQYLTAAINDLSRAVSLNPGSADLTRSLAALYAKKGDAKNTLNYLAQTVALEPTKAQNFYDLARIQTQTGQIAGALDTYNRLLTIVADPVQKQQVESEAASLQKLVAQNQTVTTATPSTSPVPSAISLPDSPSLIQADAGTGLIIAAPETVPDISVSGLTDSNALAGSATLPSGQKSINIQNSELTATSQVYVSITSGGKNQNLQVLSRDTSSFTVGLDSPITQDIVFKWWIVNP